MSKARILIIHSDSSTLALLTSMLQSLGHEFSEGANDRVAVRLLERGGIDLVLAGVDPHDGEALELLAYIRRKSRCLPVVLLFQNPHPDRAKEALRQGSVTVLRFPLPATELRAAVTQALESTRVLREIPPCNGTGSPAPVAASPVPLRADQLARGMAIVGEDPSMRQALELASTIAPTRTPVLILGEQGTGKALLARSIHSLSSRPERPFIRMDSATLTEDQFDHELGGLRSLASTEESQNGNHARAHEGTITVFLEEVAHLSDSLQGRLLRALQDNDCESGGSNGSTCLPIRFIVSSSENLPLLVERGKFRQDLYDRFSVICKLPPLRHRGGDIERLAETFRSRFALEFNKEIVGFTRDALESLSKYEWPGNVHELERVIRSAVHLCHGVRITSGHLIPGLNRARSNAATGSFLTPRPHLGLNIRPLKEALEEPEKQIIIQALQALNWNRQETARMLDINRTTLYKKMKKYGLLIDEPIWVN